MAQLITWSVFEYPDQSRYWLIWWTGSNAVTFESLPPNSQTNTHVKSAAKNKFKYIFLFLYSNLWKPIQLAASLAQIQVQGRCKSVGSVPAVPAVVWTDETEFYRLLAPFTGYKKAFPPDSSGQVSIAGRLKHLLSLQHQPRRTARLQFPGHIWIFIKKLVNICIHLDISRYIWLSQLLSVSQHLLRTALLW